MSRIAYGIVIAAVLMCGIMPQRALYGASWDFSVDPVTFILGGFAVNVGRNEGAERYVVGIFKRHYAHPVGNDGWTHDAQGVTLRWDHYLNNRTVQGTFVGMMVQYSLENFTYDPTGNVAAADRYAAGFLAGYRFQTSFLGLEVVPSIGIDYYFPINTVSVDGQKYHEQSLRITPELSAGWHF
jgi:hypothetical protein